METYQSSKYFLGVSLNQCCKSRAIEFSGAFQKSYKSYSAAIAEAITFSGM
jgi:hypothetical protein